MEQKHTIWNATALWRENRRVQAANNITKPSTAEFQVGGTATVAFDDWVFRISKQGSDIRLLGRWAWLTITGKNNCNTTIITCYCPVRGKSTGSVYSQQLIYMAENRALIPAETTCPRQLYGIDLKLLIEEKAGLGHQIIVCGDFNSDYPELKAWMLGLNLEDLLSTKYGLGPRTYKRSKDCPIDCCFGIPSLKINRGGYLSFGRLHSDHRGVWIDIPARLLLGYKPSPITYVDARRLKLIDPRVVTKYQSKLIQLCFYHNIFQKMDNLHKRATYPLSPILAEEYEAIDAVIEQLMEEAEKKCRKLRTGEIPWSPAYKKVYLLLLY